MCTVNAYEEGMFHFKLIGMIMTPNTSDGKYLAGGQVGGNWCNTS